MTCSVKLGLGLIGIGRPWGHANPVVPIESEARALLECAFRLRVRYYDTAPSYGISEERFGTFLRSLAPGDIQDLTVATKFGEHWDATKSEPFVDHSFDALTRSLDTSFERLGKIDVLQLHKTTPEVLRSDDLRRAWQYARSLGVRSLGASVSDAVSAEIALADADCQVMQLPYNRQSRQFGDMVARAVSLGKQVVVNRPFAMGKMLYGDLPLDKAEAFRFVLNAMSRGVILTGTKSAAHLEENWRAFSEACAPT